MYLCEGPSRNPSNRVPCLSVCSQGAVSDRLLWYQFCRTCIERIKSDNKPCPLCNVQFTNSMPDKRLQRRLNMLQAYCCHKETGCEWVGELGSLPQHLNLEPQDEGDRMSGCLLASIGCAFCGNGIQRKDLKEHESECSEHPYICECCEDYESTFEDVTTNHWPVCPSRPVLCPNECGMSPKLWSLNGHIENECPLQLVDYAFKYAGCNERLPRRDMPDHITQSLGVHMSLQVTTHQQELKKFNGRISDLEKQLFKATELQNQSAAEITELRTANQMLKEKLDQECKNIATMIRQEIKLAHDQAQNK